MAATDISAVRQAIQAMADSAKRNAEEELRATILAWMQREDLNRSQAAEQLGVSRETLRQMLMTAPERTAFRESRATYIRTQRRATNAT